MRAAADSDHIIFHIDDVCRKCCAAIKLPSTCNSQCDARTKYKTTQRFNENGGIAATQDQQQSLVVQSCEMKQVSYASLCIEPAAELPLAIRQVADLAGELAMREGDGVRAFHKECLGGRGCRHARRSGGGGRMVQGRRPMPATLGAARQLVVPLCRKYYAFSDTNHARHILPTRNQSRTGKDGARRYACFARAGAGTGRATGTGSHALRRLGKERALHRLLIHCADQRLGRGAVEQGERWRCGH